MAAIEVNEERIASYLAHAVPAARRVEVTNVRRILGGASRETWSCDAGWETAGHVERTGLIFRIDPPASLLPANDIEFDVYQGLQDSWVPVPRTRWRERDDSWFGGAFFVMDRIDGCETSPQAVFRDPYLAVSDRIGDTIFEIGGRIAAFDWKTAGWTFLEIPRPDTAWQAQLDDWAARIEEARCDAQPIVRVAIDWLRRNPPPPAQRVSLVHGDHRNGNVLYNTTGEIRGVLDWEMAHLGDPIEDLAWTCMPDWRWGRLDRYAGLVEPARAFELWEEASGLEVDPIAFHWWSVFSQVKAQGIWLTGERSFIDGRTAELRLPAIGALFKTNEDRIILDLLDNAPAGAR
jgi:aminoglycoside phosphotransferase (APT) family kinase protein